MKKNALNNTNVVPPGFCLEKYVGTNSLKSIDWLYNIKRRSEVYMLLFGCANSNDCLESTKELINQNIALGFAVVEQQNNNKLYPENGLIDGGGISLRTPVAPLSVRHLESLSKAYEKFKANKAGIDDSISADEFSSWATKGTGLTTFVVNLNAPDETLKEQLLKHVEQKRKSRGIEKKTKYFTGAKLRNWSDSKVIPYLDLFLWYRANMGRDISDKEALEILFPANINSMVTTIKHAKEIIKRDYATTLFAQANENR